MFSVPDTVGKRAEDIPLECFNVYILWWYFSFLQFVSSHLFCENNNFTFAKTKRTSADADVQSAFARHK